MHTMVKHLDNDSILQYLMFQFKYLVLIFFIYILYVFIYLNVSSGILMLMCCPDNYSSSLGYRHSCLFYHFCLPSQSHVRHAYNILVCSLCKRLNLFFAYNTNVFVRFNVLIVYFIVSVQGFNNHP